MLKIDLFSAPVRVNLLPSRLLDIVGVGSVWFSVCSCYICYEHGVIIIVDYVGRLRIKVMKLLTTYMSIEHYLCKSKSINITL